MDYGLLLLGEHSPDRLINLARWAEAHNFRHLWYADEKFYRDPYVSLAYVAQNTSRIAFGPCVTDPFTRHPAITAMALGTLDEFAGGGRAVLGIGAGFSGIEAMGIQRGKTVAALREAIDLIRRLWAGETVTLEGSAVSFHDGQLNFGARPDIPILIASAGPQILRLAGEVADMVMLGDLAGRAQVEKALAHVEQGAQRAGRTLDDITLITRLNLIISDDAEVAQEPMKPWILIDLWHIYPNWSSLFYYSPDWDERLKPLAEFIEDYGGKPRNVGDYELVSQFSPLITPEMVQQKALAGSVAGIVGQIVELAKVGIKQITLYPVPVEGQTLESTLAVFGEEIMPRAEQALSRL